MATKNVDRSQRQDYAQFKINCYRRLHGCQCISLANPWIICGVHGSCVSLNVHTDTMAIHAWLASNSFQKNLLQTPRQTCEVRYRLAPVRECNVLCVQSYMPVGVCFDNLRLFVYAHEGIHSYHGYTHRQWISMDIQVISMNTFEHPWLLMVAPV